MLLRSLLRATAAASPFKQSQWHLTVCRSMAAKASKPPNPPTNKGKKPQSKFDPRDKKPEEMQAVNPESSAKEEAELRRRQLAEDEKNPALDVGPNGRPLFASASSLSLLNKDDVNTYFKFRQYILLINFMDELKRFLPEGLPLGMMKEFEESYRSALLVRQSFIDLRDNFCQAAKPSIEVNFKAPKVKKQIVLDGPLSCGKSIALAMLVYWARKEGWLVFYVPKGREWTHGGLFYKNPQTGLWDTPVQAANILQCGGDPFCFSLAFNITISDGHLRECAAFLQRVVIATVDFLKFNKSCLQGLKCNILDPIPLGEGAGVGWPKGSDKMPISEGTTLYELVEAGLNDSHAAVGVVVRLRKELAEVTSVPVLFAIDQYNSWFTFTDFEEPVTVRSCRPVHARELATAVVMCILQVNAFRSMMHDDMMVGAFSHSTAVGKLRQELPDVPADARNYFPRYSLDEANTVCHYYLRQRLVRRDAFTEANWKKIFYLSNGNGTEMRRLVPFMR
ncbi:mitochondrial 28S ribosomal protein S29-related [Striga asiatica]|uniref:Small ribosomal subunit protein mS29 n=1 Tax=Striga asiatica TaxID=4170 RepID=A0A5A7RCJ6_STRAF|nr:mitochondrial 28S ribosomal protein S29-related [Striga asiatica]